MSEIVAPVNGACNGISHQSTEVPDSVHASAHRLTSQQMDRGRQLGALRAKRARIVEQIQKIAVQLVQIDGHLGHLGLLTSGLLRGQEDLISGQNLGEYESSLLSSSQEEPGEERIPTLGGSSPRVRERARKEDPDASPDFLRFWALYPRKVKRLRALRTWIKLNPSPELAEAILAALRLQLEHNLSRTDRKYIDHPSTWLNERCWEDEVVPIEPKKTPLPRAQQAFANLKARLERESRESEAD